ncbi:MAG TPA: hypothetical protein VLV15_08825 [Dongiaceae bacterium]|nr:hypothetical protein [Dongiaceae bacterium]
MSAPPANGSPHAVLGVFFVMLGAGLIFDADWHWRGGGIMALGAACMVAAARREPGGDR